MKSFFSWRKEDFGFLSPYIIAEIGVNHGGDVDLAKRQILLAKEGGAHAVKFQMYQAELLASEEYSPAYWDLEKEPTPSQYQLFKKYDSLTPLHYRQLAVFAKEVEIDFSCTPFDLGAVDTLNELVPFFKIASADLTNIPLLRKVAQTGKPIMLSVGGGRWEEIEKACLLLEREGARHLALLHCVLNYPTPLDHAQLSLQDELFRRYGDRYQIGYSDHVPPTAEGDLPALDLSVMRGAVIIEKHFTHTPQLMGNDHYHAMSSDMLKRWKEKLKIFRTLYGSGKERNLEWEKKAIENARRRIYLRISKLEGETLNPEDIIALRGDRGIEISEYDAIVGKKLKKSKQKDDYLNIGDIY